MLSIPSHPNVYIYIYIFIIIYSENTPMATKNLPWYVFFLSNHLHLKSSNLLFHENSLRFIVEHSWVQVAEPNLSCKTTSWFSNCLETCHRSRHGKTESSNIWRLEATGNMPKLDAFGTRLSENKVTMRGNVPSSMWVELDMNCITTHGRTRVFCKLLAKIESWQFRRKPKCLYFHRKKQDGPKVTSC